MQPLSLVCSTRACHATFDTRVQCQGMSCNFWRSCAVPGHVMQLLTLVVTHTNPWAVLVLFTCMKASGSKSGQSHESGGRTGAFQKLFQINKTNHFWQYIWPQFKILILISQTTWAPGICLYCYGENGHMKILLHEHGHMSILVPEHGICLYCYVSTGMVLYCYVSTGMHVPILLPEHGHMPILLNAIIFRGRMKYFSFY